MSKKILYILALFSFLNFGLNMQTSFAVENNKEEIILNITSEDELNELFDLELLELDSLDYTESDIEIKPTRLKEKLSLLVEILKGMSLTDKLFFVSAMLKNQLKEHKKKCIAGTAAILIGTTAAIVFFNKKKKGK